MEDEGRAGRQEAVMMRRYKKPFRQGKLKKQPNTPPKGEITCNRMTTTSEFSWNMMTDHLTLIIVLVQLFTEGSRRKINQI